MTPRFTQSSALPGMITGVLGLLAGMIGVIVDSPGMAAVAGVLALAAGVAGLRLAQQLQEQAAVQTLVEDELRNVRAQARETEARLREEIQAGDGTVDDENDPLVDGSTGLFSENFFHVALDSRVAAARRHLRPVAVIIIQVVEGLSAGEPVPADPVFVADAIKATLREADTACRLHSGHFALLLEDTPENGAIWTVERIRRHLADSVPERSGESGLSGPGRNGERAVTVWAGVACYPAHAFGADEVLRAAHHALTAATEWRQDRIEVAVPAAD